MTTVFFFSEFTVFTGEVYGKRHFARKPGYTRPAGYVIDQVFT
jgi:hypothetical protein